MARNSEAPTERQDNEPFGRTSRAGYVLATAVSALATLLVLLLAPIFAAAPFVPFLGAVVAAAWLGGLGAGLLATLLCTGVIAYLFLTPASGLQIDSPLDVARLLGFMLIGLLISALGARSRVMHQRVVAARAAAAAAQGRLALRESEERFRLLVDGVKDYAIFMVDDAGRIVSWNTGAERILGYSAAEITGQHVERLFTDEDRAAGRPDRGLQGAVTAGQVEEEAWHVRRDGSQFWASILTMALRDEGGRPRGFAKLVRDITERTRAEAAVRASEARNAAIVEAALDCIITMDHTGIIVEFNPAAERIFGYRRAEAVGQEMAGLIIPPPLRPAHRQGLAHYLATGEGPMLGQRIEIMAMRADGSAFPVELTITRIPAGEPPLFTGIMRDITDRKQAEAERIDLLRRAEAAQQRSAFLAEASAVLSASLDYQATFASLTRLIVPVLADWCVVDILDDDGSIRLLAVHHVDASKENLVRELRRHYPPDRDAPYGLAKVLRTGQAELYTTIADAWRAAAARTPDHLALIQALDARSSMTVPLVARGRTLGAITLVYSVSGRAYAEANLTLAEELARRAALAVENARLFQETQEALRARDTFLAIASHELRTPVTSIKGFVQVLLRHQESGWLDAQQLAQALPVISRGTERLTTLINDLLDVSRIRLGRLLLRLHPVDLAQVARAVVSRYQAQVSNGHTLTFETDCDPCPMLVDPDRIDQVLTNLLDNAVKYSPRGGAIRVTLAPDGRGVLLAIRDAGIGVPPDMTEAIFEPFGRAANAAARQLPGLGLGLYICRTIVHQHGGRIWVESAGEEQGTTLRVWLPRSGDADTSQAPPSAGVSSGLLSPPPDSQSHDSAPPTLH